MLHNERVLWHVCVDVCVSMYVCLDGEGNLVFAWTALVKLKVWMARYLTGCSDYLTGFWEPLFCTVLLVLLNSVNIYRKY